MQASRLNWRQLFVRDQTVALLDHYWCFNQNTMGTSSSGPKVSVCVITHNHAKFIGQCLQSILDQAVSFDFEVIVGDDASTDGTRDIVLDFAARYPGQV